MWFSINILFESKIDEEQGFSPLCEESIRLIKANDEVDAIKKAEMLGKSAEHEYKNGAGQTVKWRFIKIIEVQDLCESIIYDGIEVFSKLYRKDQEGSQ